MKEETFTCRGCLQEKTEVVRLENKSIDGKHMCEECRARVNAALYERGKYETSQGQE
jgi:uncharacterized protein YlaI